MKKHEMERAVFALIVLALLITGFNQFQLLSMNSGMDMSTGMGVVQASVIPTGTPKIYGAELGIKYDDVSPLDPRLADQTIETMSKFDRNVVLTGKDLDRYIKITGEISCEYCCGAQSIIVRREDVESMNAKIEQVIESGQITEDQADQYRKTAGDSACGCAHSYTMRGLAKYLVKEHGTEFSDEEILGELAKWKVLYFPGQITAKAQVLEEQGVEFSYVNLGSNKYRGIEKGVSSGGMVGGC
jgi:hypothetical protein